MSDVLAGLRARFLERCITDLDRLERLMAQDTLDSEEMRFLVHSLAGTAGTFGFHQIGAAAGVVDDIFAEGRTPGRHEAEPLAEALRQALTPKD